MEWMLLPLKRYAQFSGRSRRKEYWMFTLFTILVSIAASLIDVILGFGFQNNGPVGIIASLALLVPGIAVAMRRLHDTDRSGWWLLLFLLPIIGWIVLLVFYCTDGTPGTNRFGPDPKGENLAEVFA